MVVICEHRHLYSINIAALLAVCFGCLRGIECSSLITRCDIDAVSKLRLALASAQIRRRELIKKMASAVEEDYGIIHNEMTASYKLSCCDSRGSVLM